MFDTAVIYKLQQAIPKSNFLAVNLATLFGFFYTAFVLNLTVMGFLVSASYPLCTIILSLSPSLSLPGRELKRDTPPKCDIENSFPRFRQRKSTTSIENGLINFDPS